MEQAKNVKLLLCVFKQIFSLKINFHNHEIFCFRGAKIDVSYIFNILKVVIALSEDDVDNLY